MADTKVQEKLTELQNLRAPRKDQHQPSSDYHNHLLHVVDRLSKALPDSSSVNELLDFLDPFLDTLPCLFLLDSELKRLRHNFSNPANPLWPKLVIVLTQCDPYEACYALTKWESLAESLVGGADRPPVDGTTSEVTLSRTATAISRLDSYSPTLRPVHLQFVGACIRHDVEHVACDAIDTDLQTIPTSRTPNAGLESGLSPSVEPSSKDGLSLIQIQQFYVLSGLCYVRTGNWARAAYMFEHAVLMPSQNVANGLMLEAYKKWLLTSLLAGRSKHSNALRMVNQAAMKSLKALSKTYECLMDAYNHSDPLKVQAVAHEGAKFWQDDCNAGLVREILELRKREVLSSIQRVYGAMPIDELASRLGMTPQDAESYVKGLIRQGQLAAEIDEHQNTGHKTVLQFTGRADGMVSQNQTEQDLLEVLRREKALTAELVGQANLSTQSLEMTVENLETTRRGRSNVPGKAEGDEEGLDAGFGGPDSEDENIMTA